MPQDIEVKGKVCYIELEPAENGYELEFTEKIKSPSAGEYDNMEHRRRKLIFTDEQSDEAFEAFKTLKMIEREQMKTEKGPSVRLSAPIREG